MLEAKELSLSRTCQSSDDRPLTHRPGIVKQLGKERSVFLIDPYLSLSNHPGPLRRVDT